MSITWMSHVHHMDVICVHRISVIPLYMFYPCLYYFDILVKEIPELNNLPSFIKGTVS